MMLLYPSGWQPARIYMYSLAKMNKPRAANATPPFRLISSSIGAIWPNFWVEFLRLGGWLHHQRKPWHKTKCFWSEKAFPMDVFATAETHFIFNSTYYNQVDGVAMCSPQPPVLANLFMGHHEKIWLQRYKDSKVSFHHHFNMWMTLKLSFQLGMGWHAFLPVY